MIKRYTLAKHSRVKIFFIVIISTLILIPFICFYKNLKYSTYFGDSSFYITGNYFHNSTYIFNMILYVINSFTQNPILALSIITAFTLLITPLTVIVILDKEFAIFEIKSQIKIILLYIIIFAIFLLAPIRIRHAYEWVIYANWFLYIIYLYSLYIIFFKSHKNSVSVKDKTIPLTISTLTYSVIFLDTPYFAVMLFFITIPLILFYFVKNILLTPTQFKQNRFYQIDKIKLLLIFLALMFTASIPAVYRLVFMLNKNGESTWTLTERSAQARWAYSARPWHYLIPDINNPFFGNLAIKIHYKIWQTPPYYLTEPFFPKEHSLYLGYTLLILSSITIYLLYFRYKKHPNIKKYRNYTSFFLIIGITAFIFSMPPFIGFNGIRIYFPSHFLYSILPQFRAYARFGVFVFISNAMIAITGLLFIYERLIKNIEKHRYTGFLVLILFLVIAEFITVPIFPAISPNPTPQYQWLSTQSNKMYLEVPVRKDYTDRLYSHYIESVPMNIYNSSHNAKIDLIYSSLYLDNFAKPDNLWCDQFIKLGGKYIFFHKKDIIKQDYVNNFMATNNPSEELKVALAESWGYPVWGNHINKSFDSDKDITVLNNMLEDKKFKLIKIFTRDEILASRPNHNFSADKFDEVWVFVVNQDYCTNIR